MTRPYAAGTSVSAEKSRAEIDTLLSKHGATQRGIQVDDAANMAIVAFVVSGLKYRIDVPLPKEEQPDVRPKGWYGWDDERRRLFVRKQLDQTARERWRAIVLLLKAKLEAVRLGLTTIDREFAADLVLPNGKTVHESLLQYLESGGRTAPMLGDGS